MGQRSRPAGVRADPNRVLQAPMAGKVTVLSRAPLFGEAIRCLHEDRESSEPAGGLSAARIVFGSHFQENISIASLAI